MKHFLLSVVFLFGFYSPSMAQEDQFEITTEYGEYFVVNDIVYREVLSYYKGILVARANSTVDQTGVEIKVDKIPEKEAVDRKNKRIENSQKRQKERFEETNIKNAEKPKIDDVEKRLADLEKAFKEFSNNGNGDGNNRAN